MTRIEAASALLHERKESADRDEDPKPPLIPAELPKNQIPVDKMGNPKPTAQSNFTDADSRIMRDKAAFVQGYNGQLAADAEHQIIVAAELSNQAPDVEYFIHMLDRVLANCAQTPDTALVDAGYFSDANVRRAQVRGVDVYIAPARTPHAEKEPPLDRTSVASAMKEAMRAKLNTGVGDALYRRRKAIVEPVNGQIEKPGFGRAEPARYAQRAGQMVADRADAQPAQAAPGPPDDAAPPDRPSPHSRATPIFRAPKARRALFSSLK